MQPQSVKSQENEGKTHNDKKNCSRECRRVVRALLISKLVFPFLSLSPFRVYVGRKWKFALSLIFFSYFRREIEERMSVSSPFHECHRKQQQSSDLQRYDAGGAAAAPLCGVLLIDSPCNHLHPSNAADLRLSRHSGMALRAMRPGTLLSLSLSPAEIGTIQFTN